MNDEEGLRPGVRTVGSSEQQIDAAEVAAALEQMLVSPSFARSLRLQALLRYIVAERLAGRQESPKEYELGTRVFNRPMSFDPQEDPIVRVQARQLRFKLREYYDSVKAEERGAKGRLRIDLPKGTYLPTFTSVGPDVESMRGSKRAEERPVPEQQGNDAETKPPMTPAPDPALRRKRWMIWLVLASVLPLILLAVRKKMEPPPPVVYHPDPKARSLYLAGRYYWNQRRPDSMRKAIADFTQATEEDPQYAEAYVGLADSYNLMPEYAAMPAADAYPLAITAARRAIVLDDGSAPAHSALAFALFWNAWDVGSSEREFRRAITLDPRYGRAHHWFATSLLAQGRLTESREQMERARELDPSAPSIVADYAYVLYAQGNKTEAITLLHDLETSDPLLLTPHRDLAVISECEGDGETYLKESTKLAQLLQDSEGEQDVEAARKSFASTGYAGMLERLLKIQRARKQQTQIGLQMAQTYALLGQRQAALKALESAYARRDRDLIAMPADCALRSLRREPVFQQIVTQIYHGQPGGGTEVPR